MPPQPKQDAIDGDTTEDHAIGFLRIYTAKVSNPDSALSGGYVPQPEAFCLAVDFLPQSKESSTRRICRDGKNEAWMNLRKVDGGSHPSVSEPRWRMFELAQLLV